MYIQITGHSDCPLWGGDEESGCGVKCPEWDYIRKGKGRGRHMRRPKNCPAKKGVLIKTQ